VVNNANDEFVLDNGYVVVLPQRLTAVQKDLSAATQEEILQIHYAFRKIMPQYGCEFASKILAEIYSNLYFVPLADGRFDFYLGATSDYTILHSFVIQKDDKAIVDITADQFNIENFGPVARVYPSDYEYRWYHFKNNCGLEEVDCVCRLTI